MKIRCVLLALCLTTAALAAPLQERTLDRASLEQLATALDISVESDLITETQKQWLCQKDRERWELSELKEGQRLFVLSWAKQQGLYADWKPASSRYDTALILGATTGCMKRRMNYLAQLWQRGVHFDRVVWLTGDRPLDARVDSMLDRCHNESEAALILWNEAELPDEMRQLPIAYIAVPMKIESGSPKRPNTEDTIIAWLASGPAPCRALFISDQPFCGYQFAILKAALPDQFQFDLAGPGVDPSIHPAAAAITLDSIARWIYQEQIFIGRNGLN